MSTVQDICSISCNSRFTRFTSIAVKTGILVSKGCSEPIIEFPVYPKGYTQSQSPPSTR